MDSQFTDVSDLAHLCREIATALDVRLIRKRTGAAFVQPSVTLTIAYDAQHSDGKEAPIRMIRLRLTVEQMTEMVARLQEQARLFR